MQVKSIAECEHSAILSTFIKLPLFVYLSARFRQVLMYVNHLYSLVFFFPYGLVQTHTHDMRTRTSCMKLYADTTCIA